MTVEGGSSGLKFQVPKRKSLNQRHSKESIVSEDTLLKNSLATLLGQAGQGQMVLGCSLEGISELCH